MLLLRTHLVRLLIQLLDLYLLWADVTFKLFDLVIEDEFKLFQLLYLLLKLPDLIVLLLDSGYPCSVLLFTGGDVGPDFRLLIYFAF